MLHTDNLKLSRYALFIPKDDGTYVVSNTLNGAVVSIDNADYIENIAEIIESDKHNKLVSYNENCEMHKFFYDNKIFIDPEVDEYQLALYSYEKQIVQDNALNLTLIVSRQCNFRCVYCYEEFKDEHMKAETFEGMLNYLKKALKEKLHRAVSISLFGGEPFLPFDSLLAFLKDAKEICDSFEVPITVGATTNFSLVTPDRFDLLAEVNCKFYQVTVDGLSVMHDKRRPNADGSGSYNSVISNLLAAKRSAHDFKIVIRTNFDEEITAHAESFYQYIKQEFDDPRFKIYFINTKKMGGKNDDDIDVLEGADIANAFTHLAKIVSDLGLQNGMSETFTLPFQGVCYACKHNSFVIDYDGTVRKCTIDLDNKMNNVGKIEIDGTFNLNHAKHSRWVCRHSQFSEKCKECKVFPICFGGRCALSKVHGATPSCNQSSNQQDIETMLTYFG